MSAASHFLTARRDAAGLTSSELARRVGVHRSTVTRWEASPGVMTLEHLAAVVEVLDLDPVHVVALLALVRAT